MLIFAILTLLVWSLILLWTFSRFPSPPIHVCTFGFTVLLVWGLCLMTETDFMTSGTQFQKQETSWLVPYGWLLGILLFVLVYQIHQLWIKTVARQNKGS